MGTAISQKSSYFKVEEPEFYNVVLGITLYTFLSYVRGFIPVTIGYILTFPGITNEMAALFFIIPMFGFFVLPILREKESYRLTFHSSIIIWFGAVIIQQLLIKFILILIGLYITFSLLLYLLTIKRARGEIFQSVLIMVLTDLGLKAVNRGNDPISYYNLLSIIGVFVFSLIYLLYVRENIHSLNVTLIEPINESSNVNRIYNSSIFGFFLGLLIYFMYFSSPGIITLSLGVSNQYWISVFIITVSLISTLAYYTYSLFYNNERYFFVNPVILLISVILLPWIGFMMILSLLGLFALMIILNYNISTMSKHLSKATASVYFISLILFLIFLFLAISKDGIVIPIMFTSLCGFFTSISYYYSKIQGGKI
ncbi:MAG: hypothetical protein ACW99A_06940 [Candidatus Kariarchaeaceae archaeon]